MSEKLKIWDEVSKTDPAFTKQASKGAYKFTSIAPGYQFKIATELFGPYGAGWGIKVGSEIFSETIIGDTVLLNYDAVLTYGSDGAFPVHACEKLAYKTNGANGYLKVDEEARKKVVTNAITKGLSMLGFNADIFMGMFDDVDYVSQVKAERDIENAENKESEENKKRKELVDYVETHMDLLSKARTSSEAAGIHKTSIRHLTRQRNILVLTEIADRGIAKIAGIFESKKKEFVNV